MNGVGPLAAPPPATGTGTSTGTANLTVSAVTGHIWVPSTVTGTGVPAGTTITAGPASGGAGVYTTSVNTTLAAIALTFTPTSAAVVFPDFVPPSPPVAAGNPPPPAFPPPSIPVPKGPLGGPVFSASGPNYPPTTGIPATGTGTSTGTTSLAVSAVTGVILVGAVVTGTGVPTGTTIVSGPAGGGAGTYTTNQATTLTAVALTFTSLPDVFPGFRTTFPVPTFVVSNIWTVPTLSGGVWTSTLPAYTVTTLNVSSGGWGPPGPTGLGPGPPTYPSPPGAGLPHNDPSMLRTVPFGGYAIEEPVPGRRRRARNLSLRHPQPSQ